MRGCLTDSGLGTSWLVMSERVVFLAVGGLVVERVAGGGGGGGDLVGSSTTEHSDSGSVSCVWCGV